MLTACTLEANQNRALTYCNPGKRRERTHSHYTALCRETLRSRLSVVIYVTVPEDHLLATVTVIQEEHIRHYPSTFTKPYQSE